MKQSQRKPRFLRKPTVAVLGDSERVRDASSSFGGEVVFEGFDTDEALRLASDGGVDCVAAVGVDEPLKLLGELRDRDDDVPFVLFSEGGVGRDEALGAGATEYVRLPLEDGRGVGRRLRRYAEGRRAKRADRRLDSFLRHTPDGVFLHDDEGRLSDVNRQACEALGYDRDELLGMKITDFEVGIDRSELSEVWSGQEQGDTVFVEGRHRRKDGTEFPVEVNVGKIPGDGDSRFLAIVRDTTRREAVRKTLERLRTEHETVFRNVQDPVFLIGVEGDGEDGDRFVFRRLNPAYEEKVNITEDESRDKTPKEVFGDGVGAELVDNYERCVDERETLSYEETIEVPAGTRTYHTKVTPVEFDGEVTAIVGTVRDITEHRERERELERYEAYVENTSDIISHLDTDGTILYQSPSVEHVLGVEQDNWVGDNVFDHVHPDDRARVAQEFASLVETPDRDVEDVEFRMERADGSYVWIESVGTDWRDHYLGGVVVSSRDITERKRRERELERNRDLLRQTELIADTGGWEIDARDDRIRWTEGTRRIHGVGEDYEPTPEEAIGFYHPDDRDRVRAILEGFDEGQDTFDEELRVITDDGDTKWVKSRGETVREDGEVIRLRGAIQDITERKEREKSLEDQTRLLERRKEQMGFFNSLLRHDMLNSMTVIRGNAERLLEKLDTDEEAHDLAEKVRSRSDDIIDLTDRVRSVLRRIGGEGDRELVPCDLARAAEDRAESMQDVYDFDCSVDTPEEAYVEADEFLDDVIDNLLINAVEHNDKDEPRVEVTVERGDETTALRISDNGPGIPETMREDVFRRGSAGKTSSGVGFGLYFADSMVSEYGGEAYVEDNEPEGTVVVVELDSAEPGEATPEGGE